MNRKRAPLPWFRFNIGDWLMSETRAAMDLEHQGAYLNYLVIHYRDGSIPADSATRAKLLRISPRTERRLWIVIGALFHPDASDQNRLVNDRCLAEMDQSGEFSAEQSERGKLGGRPKNPEANSRQKGETLAQFQARMSRRIDVTSPKQLGSFAKQLENNCETQPASLLFSVKQESQSDSESDKEEEKTLPTCSPAESPPGEEPSFFDSGNDDGPTAHAGPWEPTPAEAANLAALMASYTGERDERFAASILQLARGSPEATYGAIEACVRDAAKHAKKPPRSNRFFRKAVAKQFAPDLDVSAARKSLRIVNESAAEHDERVESARRRNHRQITELMKTRDPAAYLEWLRKHELPGETVQ